MKKLTIKRAKEAEEERKNKINNRSQGQQFKQIKKLKNYQKGEEKRVHQIYINNKIYCRTFNHLLVLLQFMVMKLKKVKIESMHLNKQTILLMNKL